MIKLLTNFPNSSALKSSFAICKRMLPYYDVKAPKEEIKMNQIFNVDFDENGRHLLIHHHSASKYYKLNLIFLILFFGFSLRNYY